MAHPNTLRSQAKSLHKRGMITDKQHDRMMAKIAAMTPPVVVDPAASGAAQPAIPETASVPGGPQSASPVPPVQPPAA